MRRTKRVRPRLLLVAAVALIVVTSGCEVAVDVGLDVGQDGSGQVQVDVVLDAEAAGRVDLAEQLRVEDLQRAGWTVAGPQRSDGGETVVSATKPFTTPDAAAGVLAEVSGPEGPLRAFAVERRSSFLTTTYTFDGLADLRAGVEGFSDDELRRALEGSGFGLDGPALEQVLGAEVADTFRFGVRTSLPGEVDAEAPGLVTPAGVRWYPEVGERVELAASSRLVHTPRLVLLALASASGVALVAVLARRRRRRQAS